MTHAWELIYVIVNDGKGSQVLTKAKELGVRGGTIFYGKGTVSHPWLNFFALYDEKKEIVMMATERDIAQRALKGLSEYFRFDKPYQGIAFTVPLTVCICSSYKETLQEKDIEEEENMYQVITTIVNRGQAEEVVEAAKLEGAKGGTIVNARGSGVHETMKLFNMDIEPEKEMVLIIVKKDITEKVVNSIRKTMDIDAEGKGIVFVQDIRQVYGIYE